MLDGIDGSSCFSGNGRDSHPNQHGASNMISLYSGFAALAFLHARDLLEFAVKLLDLPAQGTRFLHLGVVFIAVDSGLNPPTIADGNHQD